MRVRFRFSDHQKRSRSVEVELPAVPREGDGVWLHGKDEWDITAIVEEVELEWEVETDLRLDPDLHVDPDLEEELLCGVGRPVEDIDGEPIEPEAVIKLANVVFYNKRTQEHLEVVDDEKPMM